MTNQTDHPTCMHCGRVIDDGRLCCPQPRTTDHRAEADRLMREAASDPDDYVGAYEHLLAAIHDGQAEQTEWLHRIRDLLAVMAEPPKPMYAYLHPADPKVGDEVLLVSCLPSLGGRCGNCHRCTDPEPESVTVSLPQRILGRPWTVAELRMLAEWADNAGSGEAGAVLGHVADALDAANATQSERAL